MTPIDPQDPLLQWNAATHVVEIGSLGRRILVRSNHKPVTDWYAHRFTGQRPEGEAAVEAEVILEPSEWADTWLTPAVDAEAVRHVEADAQAAGAAPMTYRQRGDLFLAQTRLGTAVCHRGQGDVAVFLRQWPLDRGSRAALLEAPLWRALEATGLTPVHAAALVSPTGQTLVVRGPAGAGKSTLAYAAVQRGWRLVAEEVVWHDAEAGVLRGDPKRIHLESDADELFPELLHHGHSGFRVPIPQAAIAEAVPLGPMVFLGTRTRDDPAVEPLDAAEVESHLAAGSVAGERTVTERERQAAFQALTAHGAWLLRAGRPDATVARLEDWLSRREDSLRATLAPGQREPSDRDPPDTRT